MFISIAKKCAMIKMSYIMFSFRYRDVHFTKNVEKYIMYDLEKLQKFIACVFGLNGSQ